MTSKLLTCQVTNGEATRSAFYVVSQSKNKKSELMLTLSGYGVVMMIKCARLS